MIFLFLTAFGAEKADAIIIFDFEQAYSTFNQTFEFRMGFRPSAQGHGYQNSFTWSGGIISDWDFGDLVLLEFKTGVTTDLGNSPDNIFGPGSCAFGDCGACGSGGCGWNWRLDIDWQGGASLPRGQWIFNNQEWDFALDFWDPNIVTGHFNTDGPGFSECTRTGGVSVLRSPETRSPYQGR